jgi:hypothetical protein
MSQADRFSLDDDEDILIETFDVDLGAEVELVSRSRGGALDFSESVDRTLPAARILVEKLAGLVDNVQTIEVEFGLKFAGEVGAFIARTGTEANFRVKLVWSPSRSSSRNHGRGTQRAEAIPRAGPERRLRRDRIGRTGRDGHLRG